MNCIYFVFETELDVISWICGACNPADIEKRPNSTLTDAVVLMMATGKSHIDLSSFKFKSRHKRLG